MMAGRLPRRIRGVGWEVWVDDQGIVWTQDTRPQDAERAQVRISSIERYIRRRPVRGLLVDDRQPAGADDTAAWKVYEAFMARNPLLPVAVVTPDPGMLEKSLEIRGVSRAGLAVFQQLEAAEAWLRSRPHPTGSAPPGSGPRGPFHAP